MAPIGIGLVLVGCAVQPTDPAGTATTDRSIWDADLVELPRTLSLAEVERRFGPAEEQPGPRVTYKAIDHPGRFLWMYCFRPQTSEQPTKAHITIHHIVLADSIEEGGQIVWPSQWASLPPEQAAADLNRLYAGR